MNLPTRPILVALTLCAHAVGQPRQGARLEAEEASEGGPPRVVLENLVTRDTLPSLRGGIGFASRLPFVTGLNMEFAAFVPDVLHVHAAYTVGLAHGGNEGQAGHFGSVYAGVPLFQIRKKTEIELPLRVTGYGIWAHNKRLATARIPVHQMLIVEAGTFAATLPVYRCGTPGCNPGAASEWLYPWVATPAAGVRYTYFYDAASRALARRAKNLTEVYVHVLGPGMGLPDNVYSAINKAEIDGGGVVGVEAGIFSNHWLGLLAVEFGIGYLPATRHALLRLSLLFYGY
jgi:hypothetical protein